MKHYKKIAVAAAAASLAASAVFSTSKVNRNSEIQLQSKFPTTQFVYPGFEAAALKSAEAVKRLQNELGIPGIVVGVSINGSNVWEQGFGFSNVETQTPCDKNTKMRIASISKPISIGLLAKLKEKGLVDFDDPIQKYVPYFPEKKSSGKKVILTPRLLACHKSGIRHYKNNSGSNEDGGPEFYITEHYKNVEASVGLFKDDNLLFNPGEQMEYTTHGYTLLSAVIEGAMKEPFAKMLTLYLKDLGLHNTHLDEISKILYGRASYYKRTKGGQLINAKLTDNSYKWAGGGLVSNVSDLLKFANIMLYSYQQTGVDKPGYLKAETVRELWTPVAGTTMSWGNNSGYGLGWTVVPGRDGWTGTPEQEFHVGHGGGAVGASSVLIIIPSNEVDANCNANPPAGIAVTLICNLQNVSLYKLGNEIASYFSSDTDTLTKTVKS